MDLYWRNDGTCRIFIAHLIKQSKRQRNMSRSYHGKKKYATRCKVKMFPRSSTFFFVCCCWLHSFINIYKKWRKEVEKNGVIICRRRWRGRLDPFPSIPQSIVSRQQPLSRYNLCIFVLLFFFVITEGWMRSIVRSPRVSRSCKHISRCRRRQRLILLPIIVIAMNIVFV